MKCLIIQVSLYFVRVEEVTMLYRLESSITHDSLIYAGGLIIWRAA